MASTDSPRINARTGKSISLKMQQSDAIQKVICEEPDKWWTLVEIYARGVEAKDFRALDIDMARVKEHVRFHIDPQKRKQPWLDEDHHGRVRLAVDIRPHWR